MFYYVKWIDILNRYNLIYEDNELTKVGVNIAKVIDKVKSLGLSFRDED